MGFCGVGDCSNTTLPWYAIKVYAGSEQFAATGLAARGYDPFFPAFVDRRRYSDRTKNVNKAAFPGYLFCRLDMRTKAVLLGAPAVSYVVSFGGVALPVPDIEIDGIRKALECGGAPAPYAKEGQRIRIESGALQGLEGVLTRIDGENQCTVSVHLLQRSVAVRVRRDQILLI